MGNDVPDPETALRLFHVLLYCMAYIFGGAALIALSVYVVLVGSEMLLEPGSKPKRAKAPQLARSVHAAEETLDPPVATPILSAPRTLEDAGVPVDALHAFRKFGSPPPLLWKLNRVGTSGFPEFRIFGRNPK